MQTKLDVAMQILKDGKMKLDDAVAKAQETKKIKNKNADRAWKNVFAQVGTFSKEDGVKYVTLKTAPANVDNVPAVSTPATANMNALASPEVTNPQ